MAESTEISLDEAANLARQYVNHFRYFQKISEVVALARQLEGRKQQITKDNEILADRYKELNRMIDDLETKHRDAIDRNALLVASLKDELAAATADFDDKLETERLTYEQRREALRLEHEQAREDMANATEAVRQQLEELRREVTGLMDRKTAIQEELKKMLTPPAGEVPNG